MRKRILLSIFLVVFLGLFLQNISVIFACSNWGAPECQEREPVYNSCIYWTTPCNDPTCDVKKEICDSGCPAGSYACNNGEACCLQDTTTPTPAPGPPGPGPTPPPSCIVTAPTGLSATMTSPTSATLNWTPGINGSYQALWVSTNPNPQIGCAGSTGGTSVCPVRLDSGTTPILSETHTFTINNLLTPGAVYYWMIMNVQSASCHYSAYTIFPCGLTPSPLTLSQWQSRTVSSTIPTGTGIDRATFFEDFVLYPKAIFNLSPETDTTYPYQTLLTATGQGSTNLGSNVYITGGTLACTSNVSVTVLPPASWWQVKDSDVQSAGDLVSTVPEISGNRFNLAGLGGYPGVSAYGGYTNLTGANVSSTGWLAESTSINQSIYDYAYFANQIPEDITTTINSIDTADASGNLTSESSTHDVNNFYWYKYDGTVNGNQALTISATNIGTRKVILMVDNADANITGNVNLTDGQGFFMLIVRGDINVDPLVGGGAIPNLEGLYLADGTFNDGLGNTQLWVRGSVTGNLGVNMQRNLGAAANAEPSEFFEYAPDLIMLYPSKLGTRKINWKEVAP